MITDTKHPEDTPMAASPTIDFAPGNYHYVPSVFQYSSGAAAMPGYHIELVMFRKPVSLK